MLLEKYKTVKLYRLLLITTLLTTIFSCQNGHEGTILPQPTDTIYVKSDMEDGTYRDLKKTWFESVHSSAPDVNWRQIELENTANRYDEIKYKLRNQTQSNSIIAEGRLIGNWVEKGSINQSGSIIKTAYNNYSDKLYAIAGGGSIWRGDLSRFTWEVVNDQLRFDGRFLDIVYPPQSSYRIVGSIGGIPHYKDSNDNIWHRSEGFNTSEIASIKDQLIFDNGKYIAFLHLSETTNRVRLYLSDDYGTSFRSIRTFDFNQLRQVSIASVEDDNTFILVEQTSQSFSKTYSYDSSSDILRLHTSNSPIRFGVATVNVEVSKSNNVRTLYSYDENNVFYRSRNLGQTWDRLGVLPTTPWEAGITVSNSDPNLMMMGAVEVYRSGNGGRNWIKANEWYEYYENKSTAIHADIMYVNDFYRQNGEHNILVSNHGGISKSTDRGANFLNIGLQGLNASQYYSVRTYPADEDYIMAGSQDQGLQRAFDFSEGAANFQQFISGDYGHLKFTNLGRSMWAIFPGGWVTYYPDPINGSFEADFELLTGNQSIWMPPIITSPYNPNSIFIAGGSMQGTTGSHIVEITVDDLNQIFASQRPFNFNIDGGVVSAMAYNKSDIDQFYVLTTNGKFFKSTNRGVQFNEKKDGLATAHNLYGNTILTSSFDANRVIIGGSGYSNTAVFISEDAGESFTEMVNGLPLTTVFEMVYNESEQFIFAATEAGPYVCVVEDKQWYNMTDWIAPNQRYWSVEYLASKNKVRFATFGRGIWDFDIQQLTNTDDFIDTKQGLNIFPNPTTGEITLDNIESSGHVRILNTNGQEMHNQEMNTTKSTKIDLSNLQNGMYYIIFDDGIKQSSNVVLKI